MNCLCQFKYNINQQDYNDVQIDVLLSAELFIDMLLIINSCPCRAFLDRVAQESGILFATSGSVSFRCKTRKFLDELSYCARNRRSVSKGRRKHNRRKMPFSVLV